MRFPFRQSESATPFVIWCQERSGSSHLGMLLCSHPEIACLLEVFDALPVSNDAAADVESLTGKFSNGFPVHRCGNWLYRRMMHTATKTIADPKKSQMVERIGQIFSQPYRACGFKFKSPAQVDVYPEIMQELESRRESLRVICLTRRNVLKQAISKQNMHRLLRLAESDLIEIASCNLTRECQLPAFELDIDEALRYASELLSYESRFIQPIASFKHVKYVDYEDISSNAEQTYRELLAFLKIDRIEPAQPFFYKSTPDNLRHAISNYDSLKSRVADTEFASMI